MLRSAKLLPPTGPLTLGSDPTRFQTEPPACYRASWQLLGRDSHPLATTSLCWITIYISTSNSGRTARFWLTPTPSVWGRAAPMARRAHFSRAIVATFLELTSATATSSVLAMSAGDRTAPTVPLRHSLLETRSSG